MVVGWQRSDDTMSDVIMYFRKPTMPLFPLLGMREWE